MANEHILSAVSGAKDVGIALNMKGYEFGSAVSVEDGNYELEIVDAAIVQKKEKANERNFLVEARIVGPEDYAGMGPFKRWLPIPIGDSAAESFVKEERKLKRLLASIVSAMGEDEFAAMQTADEDFELSPEFVIGKRCYGRITRNDKGYSELSGFESREVYEGEPGPSEKVRAANERFLESRGRSTTGGTTAATEAAASEKASAALAKLGIKKPAAPVAQAETPPAAVIAAATANGAPKATGKLAAMLRKK